ncbi:PiggyBac transposable element-derived protein 5 [Stylophora pistillata]|uniref:PiggyBac transposable element-derived protein 5 n=1 Tax=Stylophora pistillata TaxID=50429 RepID=A0A2B4SED3_STYPI|nr:PiggyBac transposable element-derived protein 5 [Stylophora pistillata]
MASHSRTYTVDEILEYLDDNFDIPDDGLNSDIEGFEDEESDDDQGNFFPDHDMEIGDNEEEVTLAAVDIRESPAAEASAARGRPRNSCVNEYEWSREASDVDIPGFTQPVGQVNPLPRGSLVLDFFQLFIDNHILGIIIRETNRYARQTMTQRQKDPNSWKEVSLEELKAFLGLLIAMSIHRVPSLRDYWSTDWVLGVPAFSKVMARDRFLDIYYNIHLCDNSQMPQRGDENFDKLFKVRSFMENLNTKFRMNYNPHREQAIDEAMIKYKGQTSLKQYMPMKPIKRGIKMWCRADSSNGYLCEFSIYTGKSRQGVEHGLGYTVVSNLCQHIKGNWYIIFCDNFFTSAKLIEDLYQNKILCCGTLRSGRKGFPRELFDKAAIKRMQRGDIIWRMKGPMLALTWMDKKAVHAAGTNQKAPSDDLPTVNRRKKDGTVEQVPCPETVSSYNAHMGGVDRNDQMKSYYTIPVAGKKWWSRIFYDLIDRAIFNSFVLYQESPHCASRNLKKFRIDLAKQLVGNFCSRGKRGRPSDEGPQLPRYIERHFPDFLPLNESGKRKERRCKVFFVYTIYKMYLTFLDYVHNEFQLHLDRRIVRKLNFPQDARQKSVQLKRRIFFYLPSTGELSVARNRDGGRFCTVKGIRQLHSVRTCSEQLKVYTRERSCYCHGCIVEDFDSCENKEWVGNWKEIVLSREPSGVMTRTTEDASTIEHSVQVADLATKESTVAVAAEDDSHYDYYLLKVTSNGVISLQENFEDPYSGSIYSKGEAVLLGNFFLRENIIDRTYKLDDKVAGVFPGTVRYICGPLVSKRRRARPIYQVPLDEHEQILASL